MPTTQSGASLNQFMARSRIQVNQEVSTATGMRIVLPGWYRGSNGATESNNGSTISYTASLEYPSGTVIGLFRFGGNPIGVCADGANLVSDPVTLSTTVPVGAQPYINVHAAGSAGFVYMKLYGGVFYDLAHGEGWNFAATVPDSTATGGPVANAQGAQTYGFRPIAIIGNTSLPSVGLIGTSRTAGTNDTPSADGSVDVGEIARSLGKANIAFVNVGCPSAKASDFVTIHAKQVALITSYCSAAHIEMGINDLFAGATDAALRTAVNSIRGFLPSTMPVTLSTMDPETTSTDSWASTANQTTKSASNEAARVSHNAWRMGPPNGFLAGFNVSSVTEDAAKAGVYKATGAANGYTSDGLHPSQAAYQLIRDSGVISAGIYAR